MRFVASQPIMKVGALGLREVRIFALHWVGAETRIDETLGGISALSLPTPGGRGIPSHTVPLVALPLAAPFPAMCAFECLILGVQSTKMEQPNEGQARGVIPMKTT